MNISFFFTRLRGKAARSTTKLRLALVLLLAVTALPAGAQSANQVLRDLFSPLARPTPSLLFLYEMATHQIDSTMFSTSAPDTNNVDKWFKMYEEMRNSAYDTTLFEQQDSVYRHTLDVGPDTTTMMIMSYKYFSFQPLALTSNVYFNFDTVNNILTDKYPRPGYPFQYNEVFAVSPNSMTTNYQDFVYKIDPAFIMKDNFAWINYYPLHIDFGDGTGFHQFNPNVVSYYHVHYATAGDYNITAVLSDFNPSAPVAISHSLLRGTGAVHPGNAADDALDFPGIRALAYYPCKESGKPMEKILLYLEGIDLRDGIVNQNRTAAQIYQEQIEGTGLANLRNFGYTIIVVDWKNSRIDLRVNSMYLFNLLDYLKAHTGGPGDLGPREQFTIIGESMGGLIARHTLMFMETHPSPHFPEKLHNTRLLITFDTPHKGANIPLSLQAAYRTVQVMGFSIMGLAGPTVTQTAALLTANELLDAISAKEMLLAHIDTKIPGVPFCPVGPHPLKAVFDAELLAMGNYPRFCKTMAMSNGSMSGLMQTRNWDGNFRSPNDRIVEFNMDNFIHFIKWDVKVLSANVNLLTNCNGPGSVANFNVSAWAYKVKLKWFGIKLVQVPLPIVNVPCTVTTLPYCVNSGGIEGSEKEFSVGGVANSLNGLIPSWMNPSTVNYTGNGNYSFSSGTGGWIGVGNNINLGSDGTHFCFIPTWSALDYATPDMSPDIEHENVNVSTASTPFAVIYGIQGSDVSPDNVEKYNRYHLNVRNDKLIDGNGGQLEYPACKGNKSYIRMLNREIGDDIAYVDNRVLAPFWDAQRSINEEIDVNVANPAYAYANQPVPPTALEAVFSKDEPYIILGSEVFIVNGSNLNYQPPYSGPYSVEDNKLVYCCDPYSPPVRKIQAASITGGQPSLTDVYPNPVNNDWFAIRFKAAKDAHSRVSITDMLGKKLYEMNFTVGEDTPQYVLKVEMNNISLPSGTYIVHLVNGGHTYYQKITKR